VLAIMVAVGVFLSGAGVAGAARYWHIVSSPPPNGNPTAGKFGIAAVLLAR